MEKRLDDNQPRQPQRAEVEAVENVESSAYNAADTVYHKGKNFAENKIKQRVQQIKVRKNQSSAPHDAGTPKRADHTPKTRETVQSDISPNAPKQHGANGQQMQHKVKTKEEYIESGRVKTLPLIVLRPRKIISNSIPGTLRTA